MKTSLATRLRRLWRTAPKPAPAPPAPTDADFAEMVGVLGVALLQSSRASSAVERVLHELLHAYGRDAIRSYVLPTLVLVQDAAGRTGAKIFPVVGAPLRLDQSGDVERLIDRATRERMAPHEVVAALDAIRATRPRFGAAVRILGHIVLTVGFGMLLAPIAAALPVYAVLGALVGVVVVFGSRVRQLQLVLPVVVPFAITLPVALWVAPVIGDDPVRIVAPALVTFLPGLGLTLAAVELTSNQMVAGASRLVHAAAQLALLLFGVYAALSVAGVPAISGTPPQLGLWAPWVGVLLTALGYTLYAVAPRRAFPWILVALAVAYGAQSLGALLVGAELSGFAGALVAILAIRILRRLPGAPPEAVMLICAYWLLVPGSLGFIDLSRAIEGSAAVPSMLGHFLVSIGAIALGMVVGVGLTRESDTLLRRWGRTRPAGVTSAGATAGGRRAASRPSGT
jgi:uncharacterized membrane protein YjjP (DUF1212 family)/uncharacterized membrane protein YjjB (DUF3815 family)